MQSIYIIYQDIMSFWNKIFGKKDTQKVGGMEDFMTLIRVYFQASMDLRVFKATLKVPTINNKLGVGERSRCKNMLKTMYGMDDEFFKEIDQSLRKRCKKVQDAQTYMLQFQGLTQDIMMLTGNLMKFKLRLPGFMKKALYTMTEKTVNDIFNKNDFSDASVMKTVVSVREYNRRLGFSQKWITDFVYKVVMLAKKEPRPSSDEK